MIAFAYERIATKAMKPSDFKSSESEERNDQMPEHHID